MKATLHWVAAEHAVESEVRLYDHLFTAEDPVRSAGDGDVMAGLNPESLDTLAKCPVEPSLASAAPGANFQFERQGYFCVDRDSTPGALVFNRSVSLRDTWARIQSKASN